jgi:hypothetical protein
MKHRPTAPFFKDVRPLPDYKLEIETGTGNLILFDFKTRLQTAQFGDLRDETLFQSVCTDGERLLFRAPGHMGVEVTAADFLDLLAVDRTKL